MKRLLLCVAPWLGVVLAAGCLPGNPSAEGTTTGDDTADSTGGDDGGPMAGGELLGCPDASGCTMVMAVQTLDDRVEVFVPDHPDSAYRGTISVDLEPNECAGCGPGDIGEERLDEPFGIARAGGFMHLLTGHYPVRTEGSLVSFPLSFLADYPAGSTVPVSDYFSAGSFLAPVLGRALGQLEPIFMFQHDSGRLIVGVFNNDLFAAEESWMEAGRILVIDPSDPEGEIGETSLLGLNNGQCNGASQVIELSPGILAVACDGNEGVAVLDGSGLATGTVTEAAATLGTGNFCALPGAMAGKRVRYLAPDGLGGFLVAEGPTPQDVNGSARLWHMAVDCQLVGDLQLSEIGNPGDWQLAEVVDLPGAASPTWLVASGSSLPTGLRGIYVAYQSGGDLELCPTPIGGFSAAWDDGASGVLEPYALALTSDGANLAVGAGPFIADPAGIGRGKILWATLSGTDPCSLSADVIDLTDGGDGRAPAAASTEPSTFRRGPNVVVIQEIPGT